MSDPDRPWLAHYDAGVAPVVDVTPMPVFEHLDRTADAFPDRPAIVFARTRITYARLRAQAETVAANLRAAGIGKGDRVAIMLPNTPQAIIAYCGVLKAGAVAVMVNPLYMDTELRAILADSVPSALIILDLLFVKHQTLLGEFDFARIYVTRIGDALTFPLRQLYALKTRREGKHPRLPYDGSRLLPWKSLLAGKARYSAPDIDPATDLAVLQYTGGTTGTPKGVMLPHAALCANVHQCHTVLHGLGVQVECFLGLLPYFHIYGLTVCVNFALACGATMAPLPRFSPAETLAAIVRHRSTVFPGTPSVYAALLRQKGASQKTLGSIRYCVSGSAPMSLDLIEQFQALTGAAILEGYGLTEASPITHLNPLEGRRKPGSIGIPMPGTLARVVDMETGKRILPPGEPGELVVRGPQVMRGYWGRPDDTADVLRDGWLHTGDLAVMDEEGYFFILDRKKDLIISGGYNIYPREIEEVLVTHPQVKEAAAIGVPHPTRGEVVKVFVVPEPGTSPTRNDITAYVRERLANYKVPRFVEFRSELPKTMVGKVLRRCLREEPGE